MGIGLKKYVKNLVLSKIHVQTWSNFYYHPSLKNKVLAFQEEFEVSNVTPLCNIMNAAGSDKGQGWHNYTRVYHQLFKSKDVSTMFELGIGTNNTDLDSNMGADGTPGASLRAWRSYFTNASITAADIDSTILCNEERIQSFVCDQTSPPSIEKLWDQEGIPRTFDVMVEDGLHTFDSSVTFFENSIHKLAADGVYVVEDISNLELGDWNKKISMEYTERYPNLIFQLMSIPNLGNASDNNLLVIYAV